MKTKRKTYVQCKYNRWENITLNNQKSTDISKPAKSPALVDTISSSCITSFKSWKQEPNLRPSHPFQENVPKKKNEKSGFMKLGFWGTGRERKLVDMNWNWIGTKEYCSILCIEKNGIWCTQNLSNVESVQNENVVVVFGQRDYVPFARYFQAAASADFDVRTLEFGQQRSDPGEDGDVEPVSVAVADQDVSGIRDVDAVREVCYVLATDATGKLAFLAENNDTVTLKREIKEQRRFSISAPGPLLLT